MSMDDLFKRTGDEDFSNFLKVMISGPPKSGKTTLLGTVPGILVLDTEPHANNLESIKHLNVPYATITNTDDLRHVAMVLGNDSLRKQLAQGKYGIPDIQGVAIDTLDTLQKLMKKERMKEQRTTQFLRDDWGWLKTELEAIIEMFTALPMHVFFVVHTKTQEIGKGDDSYTTVLPGLEGSIAQSIAGMVGYSLLSFRKEELKPDGTPFTKYWLQTEGDRTHDFLGTRTAGALPSVIEPSMKTIYDTIMANRPKIAAPPTVTATPVAQAAAVPTAAPTETKTVDQNPVQAQEVQTPVETPAPVAEPVAEPVAAPVAPTPPPAEKADAGEPVSPAAMGHVKRVYDALEIPFPEEIVTGRTMGEARDLVKYWRAIQADHSEGKGQPGVSAQGEMLELMTAQGWIPEDGPGEVEPEPEIEAKVDGTIAEVKAYAVDLTTVQEAYELESARTLPRTSLITWLEAQGAKPAASPEPEVSTPVETQEAPAEEPVTPAPTTADTSPTENEAVQAVEEGLGGTVIEEGINPQAPCSVCGKPIDDLDLAELGKKRFDKVLCVNDYLAELKR